MTQTDICNLALAHLGQESIQSVQDENNRARKCRLFYPVSLATALRLHEWNFAARYMPLARVAPGLPQNTYLYPPDAVCVHRVREGCLGRSAPFKVITTPAGRMIVCDVPEPSAEYTANITDESLFDPAFVKFLSYQLAADLALALTGKESAAQNAYQKMLTALDEARTANKQEGAQEPMPVSSYLEN